MRKLPVLLLSIVLIFTLCACGESKVSSDEKDDSFQGREEKAFEEEHTNKEGNKDESTTESGKDVMKQEDSDDNANFTTVGEDRYLTYVLKKFVNSHGETQVYLTEQRDYDSWQVPIEGVPVDEPDCFAKLRFIAIDWNADGTIKEVNFGDFTTQNTFGKLTNPGNSGELTVNSYVDNGAANGKLDKDKSNIWNISINGTEIVLVDSENNTYYFYEDHFGE